MSNSGERILILDNVRSVINVGAIFRTADAVGISKIYLAGYTPAPVDRFKRKRKDFAKSALGAEESVNWESVKDPIHLINDLKEEGFQIISLEQTEGSVDYKKIEVGERVVVIVGNEVDGVSDEIIKESDLVVEIPMRGKKESLNVSTSTGILLFRLFDR